MRRRGRRLDAVGRVVLAVGMGSDAQAHRLDELLQATLVTVEADRIRLDLQLTPGVAVAPGVVGEIDADRDGSISPAESSAYARQVADHLVLRFDGQRQRLDVLTCESAPVADLQAGTGALRIALASDRIRLWPGPHDLGFENRHRPEISVYLVNAVQPAVQGIRVESQQRDETQSAFSMNLVMTSASPEGLGSHAVMGWSAWVVALGLGLALLAAGLVRWCRR